MRIHSGVLALGLLAGLTASSAQALSYTAALSITYFDPTLAVSGGGAGSSSDGTGGAFDLAAGDLAVGAVALAPAGDAPAIVALEVNGANAAGSFAAGVLSMALTGEMIHYFFTYDPTGAIPIPLDPVGVGGSANFSTTVLGSLAASGTITGDTWTTGSISLPGPAGTLSASGFDARALDGTGAVRLVSPFSVALDIGPNSYPSIPGYAQLDLLFVPEPGTGLLLLLGLAAIGARRLS